MTTHFLTPAVILSNAVILSLRRISVRSTRRRSRRVGPATRLLSLATWLLALTVLSPAIALAQGTPVPLPALAITNERGQPGPFHVALEPGESTTLDLRLAAGDTGEPVEAIASVANVVSPPNGGFALAPAGTDLAVPATWLEFETGAVTLEPGDTRNRTLTVAVPGNAEPGIYVAAVAIHTATPVPIGGGTGIGQLARAVAAVTIEVPGDIDAEFELAEPTLVQNPTGAMIQVPIENTGNAPVHPQGTLTLESASGEEAFTAPIAMGAVYAGGAAVVEIPLTEAPPPGDYELILSLTDPDTRATARLTGSTLAIPHLAIVTEQADQPAVTFQHVAIDTDGSPLESVSVTVDVANVSSPVANATLTLEASRNGQLVDAIAIAEGIPIADGVTTFTSQYSPEDGFTSGLWTFRVRLESIDANGDPTLIAQSGTVAKIDVP
jgi:hypothetical protein